VLVLLPCHEDVSICPWHVCCNTTHFWRSTNQSQSSGMPPECCPLSSLLADSSQAYCGQSKLTQCTVRRCGAGPAEQVMPSARLAAVLLSGAATVGLQQCYVEVRYSMWVQVTIKGILKPRAYSPVQYQGCTSHISHGVRHTSHTRRRWRLTHSTNECAPEVTADLHM
jgi:hypothetical protein